MSLSICRRLLAVAALALGCTANGAPLPPTPANVYHFCINHGSVTWAYVRNPASLIPLVISPFVDFAGYSIEIRKPSVMTINVRIASGGSSGSIAPFGVTYDDVAKNINMNFRVTEAQVAHFSQAINSISFADTHFGLAFTIKDPEKPLSEENMTNLSLSAQTDKTGCANFPPLSRDPSPQFFLPLR